MRFADRFVAGIQIVCWLLLPAHLAAQVNDSTTDRGRLEELIQQLDRARLDLHATREEVEQLRRRIEELERAKTAREDATRSIIRQTFSELGSRINDVVDFGGTIEVSTVREKTFENMIEQAVLLNTAQVDFEILVSEWVRGSFILEYVDGSDAVVTTTSETELAVDRMNVDTAFLVLGDTRKSAPYAIGGRMVVPFGISTGDPVADVLTIEDPLTVEAFETRRDAVLVGLQFPTPEPVMETPMLDPRPVKPVFLNPLIRGVGRLLGYKPFPLPPAPPSYSTPVAAPPMFNLACYSFGGRTFDRTTPEGQWNPPRHIGATGGFRRQGNCREHAFCAWSIGMDVDWNRSVFDSRFLAEEYGRFLQSIGYVPGMAASIKSTLGPLGVVGEWNGALGEASFLDQVGRRRNITPRAWQVAVAYQLGWTPAAVSPGAQGTYLTAGYSETRNLAGVSAVVEGRTERVGALSRRRFLIGAGEWITDGLRFALEYSRDFDYDVAQGGTGRRARSWSGMLTYEW